jgi:hypothetical protein
MLGFFVDKNCKIWEFSFGEINQNISNTEDEIERHNQFWNVKF